jgi:hypothetical protein
MAPNGAPNQTADSNTDVTMGNKSESEDDEDDDEEEDEENNDMTGDFDLHMIDQSASPMPYFTSAGEVHVGKDPLLTPMSQAGNPSLSFDWDWSDTAAFYTATQEQNQQGQHQQQPTPPNGSSPWYEQLGGVSPSLGASNPHLNYLTPTSIPEQYFDFNAMDPSLLEMYRDNGQQLDTTALQPELSPTGNGSSSPNSHDRKGSVTVILNQVDADVAQQIIGGVLRHTANLSIRLQMN